MLSVFGMGFWDEGGGDLLSVFFDEGDGDDITHNMRYWLWWTGQKMGYWDDGIEIPNIS